MRSERFFKNPDLPFAELRYSRASTAAFKPRMLQSLSIGAVDEGEVIDKVGGQEARLVPGAIAEIASQLPKNTGNGCLHETLWSGRE